MKLFKTIASAALIGASFVAINPAEARTHCTTNRHGAAELVARHAVGGR